VILALIKVWTLVVFYVLVHGYAALAFTMPSFTVSVLASFLGIVVC
jgi:hypothetical protein